MEREAEEEQERREKRKKGIIQIPSYQEVYDSGNGAGGSSNPKPYNPSLPPSFSQAFSFLKSSEFYSPPPPPPLPPENASVRNVAESQTSASVSSSTSANTSATNSSAIASAQNRNAILVSHRQKGNPLLKHIRNVRWMFADIVCDYLLGQSSCALYISLRYHLLHPDYLYFRIRELQKNFKLRVVLCHVDVEDVVKPLHEVTKTAMLHDCTLLCAWSVEECGRYLETIKVYENKPADSIREHTDADYLSRLTHALTTVRRVNKTDVVTLGSTFGSLSRIMDASMEELARCPGIGERKVKRLYDTFHEPFRRVCSRPTVAAEEPSKNENVEEPPSTDDGEKSSDTSKMKKGSSLNVRSALTAAFAKHADRIRKQGEKSSVVEEGCSNSSGTMASKDVGT